MANQKNPKLALTDEKNQLTKKIRGQQIYLWARSSQGLWREWISILRMTQRWWEEPYLSHIKKTYLKGKSRSFD